MAADHFCLRWNNYQSNMVSELDILRTEEHLVDVTLSCEGQKFRAHKVILSACSAYFRNVFKVSYDSCIHFQQKMSLILSAVGIFLVE